MINITLDEAKEMVGPGWGQLIEQIYNALPENAVICQIKEKFGGLRFYVDNISQELQHMIGELETKSETICELCGKPGKTDRHGWWKTLCPECFGVRFKKGVQIVYIPSHADGDIKHPDVEFGFVTGPGELGYHFCRYWEKNKIGFQLRTLINSESTPDENLQINKSVDQEVINTLLKKLGY
jgi:hypothetical protein